ncbi:MAG: hypothetical protein CMJ90_19725 [Planctomycetes bacterium]|nr:hypothetical protein [Planctomycetota bacterium]
MVIIVDSFRTYHSDMSVVIIFTVRKIVCYRCQYGGFVFLQIDGVLINIRVYYPVGFYVLVPIS